MKITFNGSIFEFVTDGVVTNTGKTILDDISKNRLIDWIFSIGGIKI